MQSCVQHYATALSYNLPGAPEHCSFPQPKGIAHPVEWGKCTSPCFSRGETASSFANTDTVLSASRGRMELRLWVREMQEGRAKSSPCHLSGPFANHLGVPHDPPNTHTPRETSPGPPSSQAGASRDAADVPQEAQLWENTEEVPWAKQVGVGTQSMFPGDGEKKNAEWSLQE